MRLDPSFLERSPVEGARAVAMALLGDAERALVRMERADEEALHDFRVSLRRLRSTLRAFDRYLRRHLRRKHQRRLRRIARSTAAARDAEVQLAWLAEERRRAPPRVLPGLDWLAGRLESRQEEYRAAMGRLAARFRRLAPRIARQLEAARASREGRGPSFGAALGGLIRTQATRLYATLNTVGGPMDVENGHRARIEAKRLRYLLEPLRGIAAVDSTPAVKSLKSLQDILGELHDAHVACGLAAASLLDAAAERARRMHAAIQKGARGAALRAAMRDELGRGLLFLDRATVQRAERAHERLTGEWLPRERAALAQAVGRVADALPAPTRGASTEVTGERAHHGARLVGRRPRAVARRKVVPSDPNSIF